MSGSLQARVTPSPPQQHHHQHFGLPPTQPSYSFTEPHQRTSSPLPPHPKNPSITPQESPIHSPPSMGSVAPPPPPVSATLASSAALAAAAAPISSRKEKPEKGNKGGMKTKWNVGRERMFDFYR